MVNILEILKKIPNLEDMAFYSPLYGDVKVELRCSDNFPIYVEEISPSENPRNKEYHYLTKEGTFTMNFNGECLLFPSKKNRDWSTFKIPRRDLPEGETVLVSRYSGAWVLRKYAGNGNCYSVCDGKTKIDWDYIIPTYKFNFKNWSFNNEDNYGTKYKE